MQGCGVFVQGSGCIGFRVQGAQGSGIRVCGCPCRALETPFCRQINSLEAQHRCCLIRDACIIDGQLVVFAPVDFVSDLFAGSGMFHIASLGAWSPRVLSSGIAALGPALHQPTHPHPPPRASPPSSSSSSSQSIAPIFMLRALPPQLPLTISPFLVTRRLMCAACTMHDSPPTRSFPHSSRSPIST